MSAIADADARKFTAEDKKKKLKNMWRRNWSKKAREDDSFRNELNLHLVFRLVALYLIASNLPQQL